MSYANKKVRVDAGYFDAFMPTTVRGRMSNYSSEMMAGSSLLPQDILQSQYIHNGFARIICDKPAEEMTRAGFEIEDLPDEKVQSIKSKLEELDAVKHFNEAIKWRRAFGGGLIVLGLNDGLDLIEPLNEPKIKDVEFMRVYDRFEAYVEKRYDNDKDPRYGKIELWKIQPSTGGGYSVHETRVLVFDGESVPNSVRQSNMGWGSSVLQNCFKELIRLDSAHKWANLLLQRMQQAVHGIPALSSQVDTPEGEALVTKRVAIVDQVRNALNTVVIDAEETYEVKSFSLSGVKDMLDKALRSLSAVSGIPVFLLGEDIAGMNTGSSNKEGWYAQIESWQNDQLRKPLDRLISFIVLSQSDGETDGGKYTLTFNPLFTPSDTELAEIDLKKAQTKQAEMTTLTGYATNGVMDQDEVREVIREEYDLQGDAPEPVEEPAAPMVLNPGQKVVDPVAGNHNPALPVGKK